MFLLRLLLGGPDSDAAKCSLRFALHSFCSQKQAARKRAPLDSSIFLMFSPPSALDGN